MPQLGQAIPARVPGEHQEGAVILKRAAIMATLIFTFAPPAVASPMPRHWHAPPWWLHQAVCIHQREGAWNDATGNGYEGGMQFLPSTYASVGGRVIDASHRTLRYLGGGRFDGTPWHWASLDSPREQLYRAWLVYRRDGNSWREWGTAPACGVR